MSLNMLVHIALSGRRELAAGCLRSTCPVSLLQLQYSSALCVMVCRLQQTASIASLVDGVAVPVALAAGFTTLHIAG